MTLLVCGSRKKPEIIETENRMMFTRSRRVGRQGDAGQRVQVFSDKMSEF